MSASLGSNNPFTSLGRLAFGSAKLGVPEPTLAMANAFSAAFEMAFSVGVLVQANPVLLSAMVTRNPTPESSTLFWAKISEFLMVTSVVWVLV